MMSSGESYFQQVITIMMSSSESYFQ
jgi:hypothetical protein